MTDGSGKTTGKCRGADALFADRLGALIQSVRLFTYKKATFPHQQI
jgi:hypothetical protein